MPAVPLLIVVNVVVFLVQKLRGDLMLYLFALWPLEAGFLPWQLVTSAFLHGGVSHIAFNMLGLWMFGREIEEALGAARFWVLYLTSVVAAAITQLIFLALTGSLVPTVGASGGVFGLLLAWAVFFPDREVVPLFPPIPMRARTFAAGYAGIELLLGVTGTSQGVAHFAHLGGMLGAWLLILRWRARARAATRLRR
ncbi:rhomboid family intramembrane serine protease [Derxia lacustris]|uniref:rhomboid family intramembrane serine protease n=1 Tax=Derxia lacustris TaxID=764842 RepID=UPI000A1713F4|nr:rhomboid family intramembrane serine protease [Derxia lacustris]